MRTAESHRSIVANSSFRAQGELPLSIHADAVSGVDGLVEWLSRDSKRGSRLLTEHGAILFRGFEVRTAGQFERIARAMDDDLKNEYLGISPRNALTDYVFTASEIPSLLPIPEHNEMSFLAHPPRSLFFWCETPPARGMGETPLADMRQVYRDLDPEVRSRFEARGIRIVRNYRAPGEKKPWDVTQLKPWEEMFQSKDRDVVEEKCAREGLTPIWGPRGSLKLISSQPAVKLHPTTGQPVWFNHAAVFHTSNGDGELRRVMMMRPSLRSVASWVGGKAFTLAQRRLRDPEDLPMHCTYGDGSEIPDADMEAVRTAIWRNLVVTPWERGDVLAIDNDAIAHGRLPFAGPRRIAVAWA